MNDWCWFRPVCMGFWVLVGCGGVEGSTSGTFDALTYNVHGLPSLITGDDTPARMDAIAPLLVDFGILGLQEDFDDSNHEQLTAASTHPTQVRFAEAVDAERVYGSGLTVLAEVPMVSVHHEHYLDCYGVLEGASDCLASKGFQVVRLQLGPSERHTLDVYNTHLEAGNGPEDTAARAGHIEQLLIALQGQSQGRAVLFLADTNLRDSDPDDLPLITKLLQEASLTDLCVEVDCPEPGRIDRILYRESEDLVLRGDAWWVDDRFVSADGVPLSDHDPIAGRFSWQVQ